MRIFLLSSELLAVLKTVAESYPQLRSTIDYIEIAVETLLQEQDTYYTYRIEKLKLCIQAGNDLFDYFAETAINDKDIKNVDHDLVHLKHYLDTILAFPIAPISMDMRVIAEDKLLD